MYTKNGINKLLAKSNLAQGVFILFLSESVIGVFAHKNGAKVHVKFWQEL